MFECVEDIRTRLLYDRSPGPTVPRREHSASVPASVQGIRAAEAEIAAFAAASGLPRDALWRFHVALDELISNVARHGAPGSDVGLEFRLEGGVLEVTVTDDAPAFNPLEAPPLDTSAGIETRPVGGLGIALVRGLMDEVRYDRQAGRNRVTLRRSIEDRGRPMEIREERRGGILVLAASGRFDSVTSADLEQRLLVVAGERQLVLDLAGVEYVSSAGLRVFLKLARRVKDAGGELLLCAMKEPVRQVFDLAGFLPLFAIEPTRELALARLGPGT